MSRKMFGFLTIVFLVLAFSIGCRSRSSENLFPGKWSYERDVDEYAGLYIYDFQEDGKLILIDYPNGEKSSIESRQVGWYEVNAGFITFSELSRKKIVRLRVDMKNKRLVAPKGSKHLDVQLVRIKEVLGLYR